MDTFGPLYLGVQRGRYFEPQPRALTGPFEPTSSYVHGRRRGFVFPGLRDRLDGTRLDPLEEVRQVEPDRAVLLAEPDYA